MGTVSAEFQKQLSARSQMLTDQSWCNLTVNITFDILNSFLSTRSQSFFTCSQKLFLIILQAQNLIDLYLSFSD